MRSPLKEEISTIKLWLARVANHLECVESHVEDHLVGLFGRFSLVPCSSPLAFSTSLPTMCVPIQDSQPHDVILVVIADPDSPRLSSGDRMDTIPTAMEQDHRQTHASIAEFAAIEDLTNKLDAIPSSLTEAKKYQKPSTEQTLPQVFTSTKDDINVVDARQSIAIGCVLPIIDETVMEATLLDTATTGCEQLRDTLLDMTTQKMTHQEDTLFQDVVVEDASYDEEPVFGMVMQIEDPIFLISIEDSPTYSMIEEEARVTEDP